MKTKTGLVETGKREATQPMTGFGFRAHADAAKERLDDKQIAMHLEGLMKTLRSETGFSHSC